MSIAFDSDHPRVAAGDIEGKVVVLTTKDGSARRLVGQHGPTHSLWLHDQTLIAGGGQGDVSCWNLSKSDKSESASIGAGQPYEVAYDEQITLFSGYTSGSTVPYIDDAKTGELYHNHELSGGRVPIDHLAFSSDGSLLAGATGGGNIALWDTKTGQRRPNDLSGHPGRVRALVFSRGGNLLAAGGPDGVTLFDLGRQSLTETISTRGQVPIDDVPNVVRAGISAALTPTGSIVAWSRPSNRTSSS